MSAYDYIDISEFFIDEWAETATYESVSKTVIRYLEDSNQTVLDIGESINRDFKLLAKASEWTSADDDYLETEITFDSTVYLITGIETDSSGLCKLLTLSEQYG